VKDEFVAAVDVSDAWLDAGASEPGSEGATIVAATATSPGESSCVSDGKCALDAADVALAVPDGDD
jgi:hypothetical protein